MPSEVMEKPNIDSDLPALPEDVESLEHELEHSLASVATKGTGSVDGLEYEDFDDYTKNHPGGENGVLRNSSNRYYVNNSGKFASAETVEVQNGALDGARGQASAQDYYYEKMNQQAPESGATSPEAEPKPDYAHMGRVQLAKLKAEASINGRADNAKEIDDVVRDQIAAQESEVSQTGRDGSESLAYEQQVFDRMVKRFESSLRTAASNEAMNEQTTEKTGERGSANSAHAADHHVGPEESSRQERSFVINDKRAVRLEDIRSSLGDRSAESETSETANLGVDTEKPESRVYYESSARKILKSIEDGQSVKFRSGDAELTGEVTQRLRDMENGRYMVYIQDQNGTRQLIDAQNVLVPRKANIIDKMREGADEFKDRWNKGVVANLQRLFSLDNWSQRWAKDKDPLIDIDANEADAPEQKEEKRRNNRTRLFIGKGWRVVIGFERVE